MKSWTSILARELHAVRVDEIPISPAIVKLVDSMGAAQGITNLKIRSRKGEIEFPDSWIAGVDYEQDSDSEEEDYEEEHSQQEDIIEDDDLESITDQEVADILNEEITNPVAETIDNTDTDDQDIVPDDDGDNEDNSQDQEEEENTEPTESITDEGTEPTAPTTTRSGRRTEQPVRLNIEDTAGKSYDNPSTSLFTDDDDDIDALGEHLEYCHNLISQLPPSPDQGFDYDSVTDAMLIAMLMMDLQDKYSIAGTSFGEQYPLHKGLKIFKERGKAASAKEMKSLHDLDCFAPISINDLTPIEKQRAMLALMYLTEKRDGTCKGRMVYNGKPTREWLSREDSTSPTATLEGIMLTAIIDAYERRDIMMADLP